MRFSFAFASVLCVVVFACNRTAPDAQGKPAAPNAASAPNAGPSNAHAASTPMTTSPIAPVDENVFARNQAPMSGITAWNDGIVTRTSPFRFVDVGKATATVLTVPGCKDVLDVATHAGASVALCTRSDGRLAVMRSTGGSWVARELPPDVKYDEHTGYRVGGDATTLVVWEPKRLFVATPSGWNALAIPALANGPRGVPKRTLLADGRFYLGYANGEWGGALVSIDVATGAARIEPAGDDIGDDPVTGIALDKAGTLWVARGQSHLGLALGSLHRLEANGAWTLVAASPGKLEKRPRAGWNLESSSFDGLAFDERGTLHLLSGSLGLVRREADGRFARVTTSWPRWMYVDGLAFRGEVAIVGTFDAGVMLVDRKSGSVRRVTL